VLKKGKSSAGFNAALHVLEEKDETYYFLYFGYGLGISMDLNAKVGLVGETAYIGIDLEYELTRRYHPVSCSMVVGVHQFVDLGLDATLNLSIPMSRNSSIYLGCDTDVEFKDPETITPFWFFLGAELGISRKAGLFLEAENGLNDTAYGIFSAGINFLL
jgi:hypothetical protein